MTNPEKRKQELLEYVLRRGEQLRRRLSPEQTEQLEKAFRPSTITEIFIDEYANND